LPSSFDVNSLSPDEKDCGVGLNWPFLSPHLTDDTGDLFIQSFLPISSFISQFF
jgi:hypothetical protein